jgi:hypothetical protein
MFFGNNMDWRICPLLRHKVLSRGSLPSAIPVFLVPIPGFALERTIVLLQTGSAEVSYRFFRWQVSRWREMGSFSTCRRSISRWQSNTARSARPALVITSVLAGNFFLRTGWARTLLVILIVPIAILKTDSGYSPLTTLGVYVNERILAVISTEKALFFHPCSFLLWAVILLLRKTERRAP